MALFNFIELFLLSILLSCPLRNGDTPLLIVWLTGNVIFITLSSFSHYFSLSLCVDFPSFAIFSLLLTLTFLFFPFLYSPTFCLLLCLFPSSISRSHFAKLLFHSLSFLNSPQMTLYCLSTSLLPLTSLGFLAMITLLSVMVTAISDTYSLSKFIGIVSVPLIGSVPRSVVTATIASTNCMVRCCTPNVFGCNRKYQQLWCLLN